MGGRQIAMRRAGADDPKNVVRNLIALGKVRKKCGRSKSRCKCCPVLALHQAKLEAKAA
jgi:hypothetical protein